MHRFIIEEFCDGDARSLDPSSPLSTCSAIDSMGLFRLGVMIWKRFSVRYPARELLLPTNTTDSIATRIVELREVSGKERRP